MQVLEYKCPGCGAPITFNSAMQKMHCASCGNEFTAEQIEQYNAMNAEAEKESDMHWDGVDDIEKNQLGDMTAFICPSCGAEIIGDDTTAATECLYCGNPAVLTKRVTGIYAPDYIVPFRMGKEEAKKALKNFYKSKPLLPNTFKTNNRIEKLSGVYVPFWLFDCKAMANFSFDATRTQSWTSGDYRYTKTMHYAVMRSGDAQFSKIPVDASKKMEDNYMDAIEPFDYNAMVPFSSAYLSGYLADRYDVSVNESMPRANQRVNNTMGDLLRSTVHGYNTVTVRSSNMNLSDSSVKYAMLPVWMLNTRYKDKIYNFVMNGQTGRLVGKLPISVPKAIGWFLGIMTAIFALGQLSWLF